MKRNMNVGRTCRARLSTSAFRVGKSVSLRNSQFNCSLGQQQQQPKHRPCSTSIRVQFSLSSRFGSVQCKDYPRFHFNAQWKLFGFFVALYAIIPSRNCCYGFLWQHVLDSMDCVCNVSNISYSFFPLLHFLLMKNNEL